MTIKNKPFLMAFTTVIFILLLLIITTFATIRSLRRDIESTETNPDKKEQEVEVKIETAVNEFQKTESIFYIKNTLTTNLGEAPAVSGEIWYTNRHGNNYSAKSTGIIDAKYVFNGGPEGWVVYVPADSTKALIWHNLEDQSEMSFEKTADLMIDTSTSGFSPNGRYFVYELTAITESTSVRNPDSGIYVINSSNQSEYKLEDPSVTSSFSLILATWGIEDNMVILDKDFYDIDLESGESKKIYLEPRYTRFYELRNGFLAEAYDDGIFTYRFPNQDPLQIEIDGFSDGSALIFQSPDKDSLISADREIRVLNTSAAAFDNAPIFEIKPVYTLENENHFVNGCFFLTPYEMICEIIDVSNGYASITSKVLKIDIDTSTSTIFELDGDVVMFGR